MERKPFKRLSMATMFFTILITSGCSDESESTRTSTTATAPLPEAQGSPALTRTDQPVTGQIRGSQFSMEQAILSGGTLKLRQGSEFFADLSVEVVLFDEKLGGKTFRSPATGAGSSPHLRLKQKLDGQNIPDTTSLTSNYNLELTFGDPEKLGIPFNIGLTVEAHQTELQGKGFATFSDIKLVDGKLDKHYRSFDTLRLLAKEYATQKHADLTVDQPFGTTLYSNGSGNPDTAYIGLETHNTDNQTVLIKLQFVMGKNGWEVANELSMDQIHQAHPVLSSRQGNLRSVESEKAVASAGKHLERYLQEQSLINKTRGTSVRCRLTESVDKASCRAATTLKTSEGSDCHRQNYLLTNQGSDWVYEANLLPAQIVDYKTGKVIKGRAPTKYSCTA